MLLLRMQEAVLPTSLGPAERSLNHGGSLCAATAAARSAAMSSSWPCFLAVNEATASDGPFAGGLAACCCRSAEATSLLVASFFSCQ